MTKAPRPYLGFSWMRDYYPPVEGLQSIRWIVAMRIDGGDWQTGRLVSGSLPRAIEALENVIDMVQIGVLPRCDFAIFRNLPWVDRPRVFHTFRKDRRISSALSGLVNAVNSDFSINFEGAKQ